ncbi:calcium-binding protein [Sinorhizobium glycinis]|uniref:Calcium-binding protein n=1 Tax=Sinorhizobium glycinis TaxID=1472378 RepID=A0A178XMC8_9HYPH|nr:calcium-binding protein [Sinorhizobium glycinis]OAP36400.1 calcium-binding protein [Sinorhizobium glycinis]
MATLSFFFPGGKYPQGHTPSIPDFIGFNPQFGDLVDLTTATLISRSSTQIRFQLDNGLKLTITGSGFTFNAAGEATGGSITKFDLFQNNGTTLVQSLTGLNLSLALLEDATDAYDPWGLQQWLLSRSDTINGSAGDDDMYGFAGNDVVKGNGGDDYMEGGEGKDTYDGGSGFDEVSFQDAYWNADAFRGIVLDATARTVTDPYGNSETIANIEAFRGTQFADSMKGSSVDEGFMGLGGRDTIDGGGGFDIISYSRDARFGGTAGVTVNLATGVAIDGFGKQDKLISIEDVRGTDFADRLTGSSVANWLRADGGNDFLAGGLGNDTLIGGGGKDTFLFNTTLNASGNVDVIEDYSAVDDTIRLENAIFTKIIGIGTLTAAQFVKNTSGTAADASDRIIYETDTGMLFYDSNGNASGGRIHFATIDPNLTLTAADFFIA